MHGPVPFLDKQFAFVQGGTCPEWLRDFTRAGITPCGDLYVGPNLPVVWLGDEGHPRGLWLGWPIAPDGPTLAEPCTPDEVEAYVYAHRGSFIYVDFSGPEPWFYLDACGTLSLVFDCRSRCVASTAWVAIGPAEYRRRFRQDQLKTYNVAAHGWIPGGESAHLDVVRLMANHRLAPLSGVIERHWSVGNWPVGGDDDMHLDAIAAECRSVLRQVPDFGSALMMLTAGNESRLLLSCLGDHRAGMRCFTLRADRSSVDYRISALLASRFHLDWRGYDVTPASDEQQERWRLTVGHNLTGANMQNHATVDSLGKHVAIGGLGGEIGRAFLWRNHRNNDRTPSPFDLAKRLKLPRSVQLRRNFECWLASLPSGLEPIAIYELAYIELRMSCWAYAQSYTNPHLIQIAPLISRSNFIHMLSLSYDLRRSQSLASRIIERNAPELLTIPINRNGNWRDVLLPLGRIKRFLRTVRTL